MKIDHGYHEKRKTPDAHPGSFIRLVDLPFSVQPFANVVRSYTCCDGKDKKASKVDSYIIL